jgi:gliding motility-associated-like protein
MYSAIRYTNLPSCTLQIDTSTFEILFSQDTIISNQITTIDTCVFPFTISVNVSSNSNILWNTSDTTSSYTVSNSGVFICEVQTLQSNCILNIDNYEFIVNSLLDTVYFQQSFAIDTCDFPISIGVPLSNNSTIVWNTLETSPNITINNIGVFTADIYTPQPNCILEINTVTYIVNLSNPSVSGTYSEISDTVCFPYYFLINNPNNYQFEWSNGSTSTDSLLLSNTEFSIYYTNQINVCETLIDTIKYIFAGKSILSNSNVFQETIYTCEFPIEISPNNIHGRIYFEWENGSSSNYIEIYDKGVYQVNLKSDTINCEVSVDSIYINVLNYLFVDSLQIECSELDIFFIPNTFTPNFDGLNDTYRIISNNFTFFKLEIFNRWGQLIFTSNDNKIGWDGKQNGSDVPQGVYPAILNYSLNKEPEKIMYFNINLFR